VPVKQSCHPAEGDCFTTDLAAQARLPDAIAARTNASLKLISAPISIHRFSIVVSFSIQQRKPTPPITPMEKIPVKGPLSHGVNNFGGRRFIFVPNDFAYFAVDPTKPFRFLRLPLSRPVPRSRPIIICQQRTAAVVRRNRGRFVISSPPTSLNGSERPTGSAPALEPQEPAQQRISAAPPCKAPPSPRA